MSTHEIIIGPHTDNFAEKLVGGRGFTPDRIQYFLGLALWDRFDKLTFLNAPYFDIKEDYSKAYVDKNGNEVASLEFQFFNLEESMGELSRIMVFYEETEYKDDFPPANLDMKWLQRKKLLMELPVLSIGEELYYDKEITLPKAKQFYNFWAVYLDSAGRVASVNGIPIINYVYKYPVNGVYETRGLIEAKDAIIEELKDIQDLDGQGYGQIQHVNTDEITLRWYDLKKVQHTNNFKHEFGDPAYFKDTYGHKVYMTYNDIKKLEYYVIYKYVSNNGKKPVHKHPLHLDFSIDTLPAVRDENGRWEFLAKTDINQHKIKLNPGEINAFWVGMKFRNG